MEQKPAIRNLCGDSHAAGMIAKMWCFMGALLIVMLGMPFSSMADIPYVYNVENTGTNYPAPPLPTLGSLPLIQPLPDPFAWANDPLNLNGTRSTDFADWEHHRNEMAAQIENYEIGTKPTVSPSQVTASYTGGTNAGSSGTLTVNVTVGTNTLTLTCPITIPSGATAPYPITIGMDSPYGSLNADDFTSRGIAGLTYSESQVTTYGNPSVGDPYYQLYPNLNPNNTGQYSAWVWGVSRVIDGLELVTNTLPIDLKHICVTGCSYAGKLALFAGAFDERIALTVAQESGGGGATSWRYSHTLPAGTVEDIDNTDYNWFKDSMSQFAGNNVSYLPEDHHELMAMCAPRALYVTGNPGWVWLSNHSLYVCSRACQQIYDTLGIADRFGFSLVGGHYHCTFPSGEDTELGYFLDKFMLGETNLNQIIQTYPNTSDYTSINYAGWYAWWGSTNAFFPQMQVSVPATATEGDGVLAGEGSVTINPTITSNLVVSLTSSNTNKVTVPASVVIPAGQSNAVFDLTIIDNTLLDGGQSVPITATAFSYGTAQAVITVRDNEMTTLSVSLPASAAKSAGTLTNAGTVSMAATAQADVTVNLISSDPSKLMVPSTVTIPNGQTSAVFSVTVPDNTLIDGSQVVIVTADVPGWTDGSNSMTIVDYHAPPDHFTWSVVPSPQLANQPFAVTNTAVDANNYQVNYMLPVNFNAWAPGTIPATNSLVGSPSGDPYAYSGQFTLGYSFTPNTNLTVTAVRSYFGDKVSIWTDNGTLLACQPVTSVPATWVQTPMTTPVVLLAGVTYRVGVHINNGTQYWTDILPATFPNGTIDASWSVAADAFPNGTDYGLYLVDLRYSTDVQSVPVSPAMSGNFNYGRWSGNLTVLQPANNVTLEASIPGHYGQSLPFNVFSAPTLAITLDGSSAVISWPVSPTGFSLEETHDLKAGSWTAVSDSLAMVEDHYFLTNSLAQTNTFYRLRK